MRRYNLYIAKNLLWAALLVTVSLTAIIWLAQALRFMDFIVNRGVGVDDFLYLTGLMLPSLIFIILPVSLLCAVIFTYHKLMSDRELVVLTAAGLSRLQLAKPAILVAMLFTVIGYYISAYLMPVTYGHFKDMQAFLKDNYASLLLQEQVFNMPVDGLTVFIRQRDKSGVLNGILVHDNRDPDAPVTMIAQRAKLVQASSGPGFILDKGSRQEFRDGKLSVLDFDDYTVDIDFYTKKVSDRSKDPKEMYLDELFSDNSGMDPRTLQKMRSQGHQRVVWPFLSVTLTILAMTIMLRGEFSRRGQPLRLVMAAVGGGLVMLASFGLISFAVNRSVFVPLIYILVFGLTLICLFTLMHDRRGRKIASVSVEQAT